jgi:uncharacterized repeat protein (TIGR03803 family)
VLVLVAIDSFSQTSPLTVLHSFADYPDGAYPLGLGIANGRLYGTTQVGGVGKGTVFSVNTDGTEFTVLHTFTAGPNGTYADGAVPSAALLVLGGTLYGTTIGGGLNGAGTVFSVSSNGVFAVLYSFTGGANVPLGTLNLSGDTLYGTTQYGGVYTNQYDAGDGMVFSVKVDGTAFTVLHSFTAFASAAPYANTDGGEPYGGLVVSGNTLYGTTALGGGGGSGTVFAINADGTGFTVLHTFTPADLTSHFIHTNTDGAVPETALILAGNTLYGTTAAGGRFGAGTVFAINPDGTGFKVLHEFGHGDGAYPSTPLALSGTTLYGATAGGTLYAISTNGADFSVLPYASPPNPIGSMVVFSNTLYGTSANGGANGHGTVFSLGLPSSPVIVAGPESLAVTDGHPASFTVTVSGLPPFSYQWAFNETSIHGATTAIFTLANAFPANAGLYSVTITNAYGTVTSTPVKLTVVPIVLLGPMATASGGFEFGFDTASNVNYTIQYSVTLRDWVSIGTFRGYGGGITFIDVSISDSGQRFYRVLVSP